jgi:hypothetical protein
MAEAAARPSNMPGNWLDAARAARWPFVSRPFVSSMFRNIRFVVPACIILICGCFAAAALVQMRLDRAHALEQVTGFAQRSAADRATVVGGTLDRFARMGEAFADSPQQYRSADLARAEPAIRDIAVFDAKGALLSRLDAATATPSTAPIFKGARALIPVALRCIGGRKPSQSCSMPGRLGAPARNPAPSPRLCPAGRCSRSLMSMQNPGAACCRSICS